MNELASLWWLIALQGVLTITALFYLARLGERRLAAQPRWVWLVAILVGQTMGSVAFLFLYFRERKYRDQPERTEPKKNLGVIEQLYGDSR
ncbi:hypothetical protein [Corynebacterium pseudotuberculosis]|uniref:hypothetical protein n=1 Tax=Corynebacterium pseudotuberculosis TaxID=1719 RepID=UPI0002F7F413|nr:hypothetical protein [Corynebacterium pseudotuberculosis]AFM08148.2 hypothetical protein CP162_09605 [Corynebacterium pseudotuberculosis Cp162]APG82558.1 protein YxlE [Corynebacterium pseudotuberculosis]WFP66975.1 hypothetical protein P8128_09525 [Corynebacterium pseudotuberculosis]